MSNDPYQTPATAKAVNYYGHVPLATGQRPGIVTAIGVISIIVAGLGLVINLGMFAVASQFYMFSARNVAAVPGPAVNQISTTVNFATSTMGGTPHGAQPGEYVAPSGLSASDRAIVIEGLAQVRRLPQLRRDQLDALLADAGQRVIVMSMDGMTADRVATYVTSVEQMPSSEGPPVDIFVLGSGRLEVSDRNAAFFPTSGASVRTDGSSYTDGTGTHLASTQINAVMGRAMELSGNTLNAAQSMALQQELRAGNQTLITASRSVAQAAGQVRSVTMLPDGTAGITTNNSSISISTTSQVVPGIMQISQVQPVFFGTQVKRSDAGLWLTSTMLAFALSAFLLVCGILVLRNFSHARLMLLIYCGARLLVAAMASFVIFRMWSGSGMNGSPNTTGEIYAAVSGLGLLGAAYPLLLLAVFLRSTVREYFAAPTITRLY